MAQPIISVENLGKSYLIGHQSNSAEGYTALRDVVGRTVKDVGRKAYDMVRGRQIIQGDEVEEFWALKDVSFEVQPGEVLGIIGRNGAGKSTLLKLLSRITEPTAGRVTLRGRVASLLEVGTGFHPELTGRENIFLNGAILGMTRAEIKRKFDEIVDFAGVEKFLDTPVKRYSSGMYVRLAFAVAAHLEPEILVVDEVLAVGDLEFQKKCLGKMKDVAAGGRTVLFVSHNMLAIQSLCNVCVGLKGGRLFEIGPTSEVIASYNAASLSLVDGNLSNRQDRKGNGDAKVLRVDFGGEGRTGDIRSGITLSITLMLDVRSEVTLDVHVGIRDTCDMPISHIAISTVKGEGLRVGAGAREVSFEIPRLPLCKGVYSVNVFVTANGEIADWVQNAATFDVNAGDFFDSGKLPPSDAGFLMEHKVTVSQ